MNHVQILNILTIFPRMSRTHASYVKESPDFISKFRNTKTKPDTLLKTLDVESMYTNSDNKGDLKAVKCIFG